MTRPDALSLVSRLVELVTQLFTERVELARGELQDGARQAGRRAVLVLSGALLIAVGIAFFAGAAFMALGVLVRSPALRLSLVGLPLVAAGIYVVSRAARSASPKLEQRQLPPA
jgi:uncharacterized membrane protein YqjE